MLIDFVALDIETTGVKPTEDDVIEVALVRVRKGVAVSSFRTMVAVELPLPETTKTITGYTDGEILDGLSPKELVPQIKSFTGGLPIVAHNTLFDLSFLYYLFLDVGEDPKTLYNGGYYCTLSMARILNGLRKNKLEELCEKYNIAGSGKYHNALYDATVTSKLFLKLQRQALAGQPLENPEATTQMIQDKFHNTTAYVARHGKPKWMLTNTKLVKLGKPDIYIRSLKDLEGEENGA